MNFGNIVNGSDPDQFASYVYSQLIDIPTRVTLDTTSLTAIFLCQ